jgi:hypothetical protein
MTNGHKTEKCFRKSIHTFLYLYIHIRCLSGVVDHRLLVSNFSVGWNSRCTYIVLSFLYLFVIVLVQNQHLLGSKLELQGFDEEIYVALS